MNKRDKLIATLSIVGVGGLGLGGAFLAQSLSADEPALGELPLSEPTDIVEEIQESDSSTEPSAITVTEVTSPKGPKHQKVKYFGESTKDVAGAKYGGQVSDYRPSFSPSAVDFSKATQANIYVDFEYYQGNSSSPSWFDVQMELSIEYGTDRGLYIYSSIGNRELSWEGNKYGIMGKIKEKHKIVYLKKQGNDWSIDEGFLYEDIHALYPGQSVQITKQPNEYSNFKELNTTTINTLCSSYYDGCGEAKSEGSTKWSVRYTMDKKGTGAYTPFNPFSIKDNRGNEFSAVWRYWRWNPHQYRFNGVYDKHAPENDRWKIPRRGMWMGWYSFLLVQGSGSWKKVCEENTGESCGLNTYLIAAAAS